MSRALMAVGPAAGRRPEPPDLLADAELLAQLERVAQLDSSVLITGARGTGKTTLALWIHRMGPRAEAPFVIVSCAALPRDLVEAELFGDEHGAPGGVERADGGTLLVDEVGRLPLELQPKLLAFLKDRRGRRGRRVNVRVISTAREDLHALCARRRFRDDLLFRLDVLSLHAPSLSERPEDLADLVERIAHPCRLTPAALERLLAHPWPGNLRELENVLARAAAHCADGTIAEDHLDLDPAPGTLAGRTLADIERQAILDTLRACRGNKAAAARSLGLCEKTIYNKLRRLRS